MKRVGRGIQSAGRAWLFSGLLVLMLASAGVKLSACVETAECNESVTCPSGEVCYEFRCRARCESEQDCADDETCTPCKPPEAVNTTGRCFGSELSACIPAE